MSQARYLLDTNVVIALVDPNHVHHEACRHWFESDRVRSWSTCPIVENGVVRILSSPSYPGLQESPQGAAEILRIATTLKEHTFLPDDATILELPLDSLNLISGPKQVTDAYLLGLCRKHGLRLATTDRRVEPSLAPGEEIVEVI